MKTSFQILVVVLILAIVADATKGTASIESKINVPASLGSKISGLLAKGSHFWLGKKSTEDETETRPIKGLHVDRKLDAGASEDDSAAFRVCYNHGLCYKKKLVCPKSCRGTLDGVSTRDFNRQKHCIFDCKKCIAHC